MNRDVVIGKRIAALRDQVGLKQNELARKLEWSAAVLSRVESGERALSDDEIDIILSGIGTPEAMKVRELLARHWQMLPEPDLADPDSDLLWEAEQAAQKIHDLAEQPDVKQFFERRLVRYKEELRTVAQRVMNKRYRVALIGTIAVGKSTAICRVEGLEMPTSKGMPKAVLETGAGGITICEVHLRKGPGYGLIIEPCTEDEIRRHVTDFANFLLNPSQLVQCADENESESGSPGISREVERALRNMTGLRRRRSEKKSDGTVMAAVDEARDLAITMSDSKALSVEILARMELHKRDRRDIWYSDTAGKPPMEWLKETFERINNGRHPEFTLPKRIELVIPDAVLRTESLSVTLIDTQGIDDIAGRADLEQHFDDPHTIVVLCTRFNDAPSISVRQLLTRAKEAGVRMLESNAAILVLPHPGEAQAMKEYDGYPVQTASDGYERKAEELQLKLHPLDLTRLPVVFFNAAEDEPEVLRSFLLGRIDAVHEFHRSMLREIISGSNALLINYEKEQARDVMVAAARRLKTWLDHNTELSPASEGHVHDSLLSSVKDAHARTVYAAVVRDGHWYNLDYAHQLSHGARCIASRIVEPKLEGFIAIATNLLEDDQLADAHDLVRQAVRLLKDGFDNIIRKAQLVGQSIHADAMSTDATFWRDCGQEWGRGKGYRDRINDHNRKWFENTHKGDADTRVVELIRNNWSETIILVRELLGGTSDTVL